jgi:lipoprotein-releasing system permease protein
LGVRIPYEWWIGWRYTRAGKRAQRKRFISFISAVSMAGIALGVAALIVVLSVMNGFQREVRDRMLSVLPHVEVSAPVGGMADWQGALAQVRRHPEVLAGAPFVAGQTMLTAEGRVRGALVRGIDPQREGDVSALGSQVKAGSLSDLQAGGFGAVIGGELARGLNVAVGDKITLVAPQGTVTPAGIVPRLKRFTVVGIFEAGHSEYDSSLVFTHVEDAAKLFRVAGVSGVRLRLADMQRAPAVAVELKALLPAGTVARNWTDQNKSWFAAVQVEKRMMFIILSLIVAVAAFNLVSMLVMTVTDKQSDIAILRTYGATPQAIRRIFTVQGWLIGLAGTVAGVAVGSLIAFNIGAIVAAIEALLGVQFLPRDVYAISSFPSDPRGADIAFIAAVAVVLSVVATLYPSFRAARVDPAQALRYE